MGTRSGYLLGSGSSFIWCDCYFTFCRLYNSFPLPFVKFKMFIHCGLRNTVISHIMRVLMLNTDTTPKLKITLSYIIFSNYYQYQCISHVSYLVTVFVFMLDSLYTPFFFSLSFLLVANLSMGYKTTAN
jgi:hypothetical protein